MKKADPISTEIIRNAFISIAQDMNAVLIRSAYTLSLIHISEPTRPY